MNSDAPTIYHWPKVLRTQGAFRDPIFSSNPSCDTRPTLEARQTEARSADCRGEKS